MARIRSIKPEFWTDEKVVSLSPLARLLFIGLWNFADDEGRGEFSPKRMKMQILPADDADMSLLLGEIRRESLVEVYAVGGKEYFQIRGFSKHQKVDKRTASKYPAPSGVPRVPPSSPDGRDQGRDQGGEGKSSEAKASGASAPAGVIPIDAKTALFRDGLDTLARLAGRPQASLRSVVGRWLKLTGDDHAAVLMVIRRAATESVADPVAWIEGALKPRDPDAEIYRGVH